MKNMFKNDLDPTAKSQLQDLIDRVHKKRLKHRLIREWKKWLVFSVIFKIFTVVVMGAFILLVLPGRLGFWVFGCLVLLIVVAVAWPWYMKKRGSSRFRGDEEARSEK